MERDISGLNSINLEYSSKNTESDFKDCLIKHGFDYCVILSITHDVAIRLMSVNISNIENVEYEFPEFFNFTEHKNNTVYKAYIEDLGDNINSDDELIPYINGYKYELLVPLKTEDGLVAFIGLYSNNNNSRKLNLSEMKSVISKHYYYINEIKTEKIMNKNLIKYIILLDKVYNGKIQFMVNHSYNVALWSVEIAMEIGLEHKNLKFVYLAALMHDIGKIYIDTNIINKEGTYTKEEFVSFKKHVEYGYNICKDLLFGFNDQMSIWIYQHHEKWDGSGYPNHLASEDITLEARILKTADAIDGMLSQRSYKNKMNINQVISEISKCSGKDFDPYVVKAAVSILQKKLNLKHNLLDEFIMRASLVFNTKESITSLSGYISKANDDLIFFTNDNSAFEKSDVTSTSLAIERLNVITEYKVTAKKLDTCNFLLENIEEREQEKSFSLLWILDGYLIETETREAVQIRTIKISATGIMFNLENESDEISLDKTYLTAIIFEDESRVATLGKLKKYIKVNNNNFYELIFVDVKQDVQTKIYHQLFQKQIDIRTQTKA